MLQIPKQLVYAIPEKIGNPDLFVGRKLEFDYYLGRWFEDLKMNIARSQAIVARRKKGKSAFLERYYNILWTLHDPQVMPFFFSIRDEKITLKQFAKDFASQFFSQYLAYQENKTDLVRTPVPFDSIPYKIKHTEILEIYYDMKRMEEAQDSTLMWRKACDLPYQFAVKNEIKIIQIMDEFQNINGFIEDGNGTVLSTMSGSYLDLAEKREAPLIVSGSEVHWLLSIVNSLVGRFDSYNLRNLPQDETYLAVEKYALVALTKIDEDAKEKIWNITRGDPLYIRQLFLSRNNEKKDFTIEENIAEAYEKELSTGGGIFGTWYEYIWKTFRVVNQKNAKRMILYLFEAGEERTRLQIRKDLKLEENESDVETKLQALIAADLISQGSTGFRYSISGDKTYELIFRKLYQEEIDSFVPDIKAEILKQMGKNNYEKGHYEEFRVKLKLKKGFNLKEITYNGKELQVEPKEIKEQEKIKLGMKEYEIDLILKGKTEIWIEVKNKIKKYGKTDAEKAEKIKEWIKDKRIKPLLMVYSKNGFTQSATEILEKNGIYYTDEKRLFSDIIA